MELVELINGLDSVEEPVVYGYCGNHNTKSVNTGCC